MDLFPKSVRLRKTPEFKRVFDAKNVVSDDLLVVFILPRNSEGPSRLGLSVSKKVGNAVVRNRWKRLIREAFRKNRKNLTRPLDLVVVPRRGIEPPPAKRLERSFQKLIQRMIRRLDSGDTVSGS